MHPRQPRSKRSLRRRRFLIKGVVVAVVGLVCFLILEVGVRVLAPQPASWLSVYRVHPRLPMALQPNAHGVVETGETRWEVWTDEQGHRCAESPTQRTRPIALWVGDSFTFGHGVDYEQSWVGHLDGQVDGRFTHINCGVPGYGPTQYELALQEALSTVENVSVVFVVTYLGNDFHDTIWAKEIAMRGGVIGDRGSMWTWMARNLHSYRLATRVLHSLAGRVTREQSALVDLRTPAAWKVPPMRDAIQNYTDAMASMARICDERSIPLVVVVIPTSAMVASTRKHGVARTVETPDERGTLVRALRILEDLSIRVVDTTSTLAEHDPKDLYFRFDGHFRPLGHEVVEDLLVRAVPELQK